MTFWTLVTTAAKFVLFKIGAIYVKYVRTVLLENMRLVQVRNELEICDPQGIRTKVRRERSYLCQWNVPEYLPDSRISLGDTGRLTSFSIIEPSVGHEVLGGGIGHDHCLFRIRCPNVEPTYLIRRRAPVNTIVQYEADNVYTEPSSDEPMSWTYRFPWSMCPPKQVEFKLKLPTARPMLSEPRVYRLKRLSHVEGIYTDLELDKAPGWKRIQAQTKESMLEFSTELNGLDWTIRPKGTNLAYKIEWDWWG